MKHNQFEEIVRHRLGVCQEVLTQKDKEYSSETDRLHNFKVAAEMTGESVSKALYGMYTKHLVSMRDLAYNPGTATHELIKDKLTDVINYCLLLEAVLVEFMENRDVKADVGGLKPGGKPETKKPVNMPERDSLSERISEHMKTKHSEQKENSPSCELPFCSNPFFLHVLGADFGNSPAESKVPTKKGKIHLSGIDLIARERAEQQGKHKLDIMRDVAANGNGELVASVSQIMDHLTTGQKMFGSSLGWSNYLGGKFQKKTKIEKLTVAGALIAAEIDRLQKVEELAARR